MKVDVASMIRASMETWGVGRVEDGDELLEEVQLVLDVGDDQRVRPLVDDDLAPGGDLGLEQGGDVLGLGIGEGDGLDHGPGRTAPCFP